MKRKSYAFIDASNLFYGGEKSLGWKVDYKKLIAYLKDKYSVSRIFYFGGVEIHEFKYDYLNHSSMPLLELEKYLKDLIKNENNKFHDVEIIVLGRHLQRVRFYKKLEQFGFELYIKPVKVYKSEDGLTKKKANCDVEMAFYLMKEKEYFDSAIILSGDGDFLPVLKYLKEEEKDVIVLSRGKRTAREIRRFAGNNFRDFEYLKFLLKMDK